MTVQFNPDEHTPCYGKHKLFESTNKADHLKAKELCKTCPVAAFAACERLLEDEQKSRQHGAGPMGTWAGKLVGATNKVREAA